MVTTGSATVPPTPCAQYIGPLLCPGATTRYRTVAASVRTPDAGTGTSTSAMVPVAGNIDVTPYQSGAAFSERLTSSNVLVVDDDTYCATK